MPDPQDPQDLTSRITAARKAGHSITDIADWLDRNGQPQQAKELRRTQAGNVGDDVGQVGNGTLFGIGPKIAAIGGTAAQKLTGDPRPMGEIYHQLEQDAQLKSDAYRDANPKRAAVGNAVGGVLASVAVPGMAGAKVPGLSNATALGRVGNAAALGGGTTGAAAAINADPGHRLEAAAEGALIGAAGGGLVSGLASGVGAGYRMLDPKLALPKAIAEKTAPVIQRVFQRTPEPVIDPGARKMVGNIIRRGKTVADVEAASAKADPRDLMADIVPSGPRELRNARTFGHTSPDLIDNTLREQARDEGVHFQSTVERLTGHGADDAKQIGAQRLADIKPIVDPLYAEVHDIPVPAAAANDLWSRITGTKAGKFALSHADELASLEGDALPSAFKADDPNAALNVGNLLRVREGLDKLIHWNVAMDGPAPFPVEGRMQAGIKQLRSQVDRLAKAHGGDALEAADATAASAKGGAESFQIGERAGAAKSQPELQRYREAADDPAMYRAGRASSLAKTISGQRDGVASGVQNPAAPVFGSPIRRMVTRDAFPDQAAYDEAQRTGEGIARRLGRTNTVTGGSQTFDKLVDGADSFLDMNSIGSLARGNPQGAVGQLLTKGAAAISRRAVGNDADAYAKYLLAGADGQMTRDQVLATLKRIEPLLKQQWARQAVRSATGGSAAASAMVGPRK